VTAKMVKKIFSGERQLPFWNAGPINFDAYVISTFLKRQLCFPREKKKLLFLKVITKLMGPTFQKGNCVSPENFFFLPFLESHDLLTQFIKNIPFGGHMTCLHNPSNFSSFGNPTPCWSLPN